MLLAPLKNSLIKFFELFEHEQGTYLKFEPNNEELSFFVKSKSKTETDRITEEIHTYLKKIEVSYKCTFNYFFLIKVKTNQSHTSLVYDLIRKGKKTKYEIMNDIK